MSAQTDEQGLPRVHRYEWCTPALDGTRPYEKFCRDANLEPAPNGHGILFVVDEEGQRHTLATSDTLYLSMLHHGLQEHGSLNVAFPRGKFQYVQSGWLDIPRPLD